MGAGGKGAFLLLFGRIRWGYELTSTAGTATLVLRRAGDGRLLSRTGPVPYRAVRLRRSSRRFAPTLLVTVVSVAEDVPETPPDNPIVPVWPVGVPPAVVDGSGPRARVLVYSMNLSEHGCLGNLVRRVRRTYVWIVTTLRNQVGNVLAGPLPAGNGLILQGGQVSISYAGSHGKGRWGHRENGPS